VTDIRERLQTTLGAAYTLERELGGGGMSRVFVADETALGRKVVVKVLPPDLAAGVSVDRFKREIQMAARLQHPHIVPVLSAGETDGLPYYTMPFVEGASLRSRLSRGPLAIHETIGILKEVARALAYAHERGVVHRDIKPDNVLLSGGSAVVTDFGIAKALSASRMEGSGSATLTAMGTSLGTPAYMAPEQAAGDPSTNHRADIYAFGCMAYEMLCGEQPFHGRSPHKLMAAHMGEKPPPIIERRTDTPAALAMLVMQCLEKEPDHRPQMASDVAHLLESVASSGTTPSMPGILLGDRGMLQKALLVWAAAFVVVVVLARAAIVGIGLPDWVFPGAIAVMTLGLPVILFTAYVQRTTRRAFTSTPTFTPGGSAAPQGTMATMAIKAAPLVSWRRTTLGGVWAVAGFIALVAAWMVMRALGIGPAASLMAAGKLGASERVILADFRGEVDSTLRFTVTEAFRADLSQSRNLDVMSSNAVRETLRRMERPPTAPVDYAVAREIATREGIKAVLEGEILSAGSQFLLSARLVAAQNGEQLATFSESADGLDDIIPAISRLTKKIRAKTGESLRTIQNAATLERVTTPSLRALEKYMSALRAIETGEGGFDKGVALLEEALAIDSGFAMAYRKLAVELGNRGLDPERMRAAIQKAYDNRDRLSESERQLTLAGYYSYGPNPDGQKVLAAYEDLLVRDPNNTTALNNASVWLQEVRQYARAESLATRAVQLEPTAFVFFSNQFASLLELGRLSEAEASYGEAARRLPRSPAVPLFMAAVLALARGDLDEAIRVTDSVRVARPSEADVQRDALLQLAAMATSQGKLGEAVRYRRAARDAALQLNAAQAPLVTLLDEARLDIWFRADTAMALETIERALREYPLATLPSDVRPYKYLAYLFSLTGRPDRARAMQAANDSSRAGREALGFASSQHDIRANIALAEGRYDEAVREARAADFGFCSLCNQPNIARAFDLAGNADSALARLSLYVEHPARDATADGYFLAGAHKRLGELYEARGERDRAISHYSQFVDLWRNADDDLQPLVRKARERLATLQRAER
jgi:tetratricopeptide (TPR) repeat protein/tRNA A-37 threonylcarbamoyl transferase component Bud32